MVVLLTGAGGFIGARIAASLDRAGHELILATRDSARAGCVGESLSHPATGDRPVVRMVVDFNRDVREEDWLPRLQGVDVVVNAAGIFREVGEQTFAAVHTAAPSALFRACVRQGVARVIQISALGADEHAASAFHRSKKAADDFLLGLPLSSLVLQPSLVFGTDGMSTRLFLQLATWPLIPLPGGGRQCIQPVHVDDLADVVARAVSPSAGQEPADRAPADKGRVAAVGPVPMTLRDYLETLRCGMGQGRARIVTIPALAMRLARRFPLTSGLLDADALAMLERGNCADPAAFERILGRPGRAPAEFLPASGAGQLAISAKLHWLLPLLRLSIAVTWLVAGIVSLGLYPVADSLALLAATGATGWFAWLLLYGAAATDLALGVATLCLRHRRWLWWFQIALVLLYTVVITVALPGFWLHPYGPVVKNLPLLVALWLLLELDETG